MRPFLPLCLVFFFFQVSVNGEESENFECFVGDGGVFIPQSCPSNTTWCLKFVNSDNDDALRLCDSADEICPRFGDRCDSVKTPDIDNLPYSSLMCCCQGERCNIASMHGLKLGLGILLGGFYLLAH